MVTSTDVFNRFCRVCDKIIRPAINTSKASKRICNLIDNSPMFTFDAEREKVVLETARNLTHEQRILPPPMPFDSCLLVDTMGVVLLFDATDYEEGDKVIDGHNIYRDVNIITFCSNAAMDEVHIGSFSLIIGKIQISRPTEGNIRRYFVDGDVMAWIGIMDQEDKAIFQSIPESVIPITSAERLAIPNSGMEVGDDLYNRAVKGDFMASVDCALDQLHYINLPRHYLVVDTPAHVKPCNKHVKTPRFHDRPKVLMIDPMKVHIIRPPSESKGGEHASPTPHLRRGHTKILKAERYKNKRWAVIHIHPTWVGPVEWSHGRSQYKVIVRDSTKA